MLLANHVTSQYGIPQMPDLIFFIIIIHCVVVSCIVAGVIPFVTIMYLAEIKFDWVVIKVWTLCLSTHWGHWLAQIIKCLGAS